MTQQTIHLGRKNVKCFFGRSLTRKRLTFTHFRFEVCQSKQEILCRCRQLCKRMFCKTFLGFRAFAGHCFLDRRAVAHTFLHKLVLQSWVAKSLPNLRGTLHLESIPIFHLSEWLTHTTRRSNSKVGSFRQRWQLECRHSFFKMSICPFPSPS